MNTKTDNQTATAAPEAPTVTLAWSDGSTTIVDRETVERYRALYGEYPHGMNP